MYAVVAPGFSAVYSNWKDVERIKALYPYPKWMKCANEQQAAEFIRRNSNKHTLSHIYNYGDTLENKYVTAEYTIGENCVYYKIDVSRLGQLRVCVRDGLVEYDGTLIKVRLDNIKTSDTTIVGHLSAIYNLLIILGDTVDVNIVLPNYSVYYALTAYAGGKVHAVKIMNELLSQKLCKVAYTLYMRNYTGNTGGNN